MSIIRYGGTATLIRPSRKPLRISNCTAINARRFHRNILLLLYYNNILLVQIVCLLRRRCVYYGITFLYNNKSNNIKVTQSYNVLVCECIDGR